MGKGIILAGGMGTRLRPATYAMNKHMVPILNRPMILYPLETLKALGIQDIMIVSGGNHIGGFAEFLGDGSDYGVNLTYRVQKAAGGIAQALALAEDFAAGHRIAVILGDNIFENGKLGAALFRSDYVNDNAHIIVKSVKDPKRFGVLSETEDGYEIVEKPEIAKSDKAVTGLYMYPPSVFEIVKSLKPSRRGELEITDVNNAFIERKQLIATDIGETFWSDAGTPESLAEVTKWAIENKNG